MDWVYRVILIENGDNVPYDQRLRVVQYYLEEDTAISFARRFKARGWTVEVATASVGDFFRHDDWFID